MTHQTAWETTKPTEGATNRLAMTVSNSASGSISGTLLILSEEIRLFAAVTPAALVENMADTAMEVLDQPHDELLVELAAGEDSLAMMIDFFQEELETIPA